MTEALTRIPLYQVDAFGPEPFMGNPAAVCLLEQSLPAAVMHNIAKEMNLSETAFVEYHGTESSGVSPFKERSVFGLRWFTIEGEVDLCGHATLATAAILFEVSGNQQPELHFETLSGRLTVCKPAATSKPFLQMTLPNCTPLAAPDWLQQASTPLQAALGISQIQELLIHPALKYVLVVLPHGTTQEQLQSIKPNFVQLKAAATIEQIVGMIVTCSGNGGQHHFLSRFFAPWVGIQEDPVTGSAHAVSGPYWANHLKDAPTEMKARQCSARGGEVVVTVKSAHVVVAGQATIVSQGHLLLPTSICT